MPASQREKVRFGPFEFDPRSEELSKGALKLKLQGQPVQILRFLLEKPGELVTREEIRQRLWPADTFVDFEHGLNTAVRKLRQALGDEADTPHYIETLPRRGYRFIAEASGSESRAEDEALLQPSVSVASNCLPVAPAGNSALKQEPHHPWLTHLRLVAIASILLLAVYWAGRSVRSAKTREMSAVPLTAYPGGEWEPALSPDGTMVAFTWDEGNPWSLNSVYVKMIAGDQNALRISPPGAACPAWSPDGTSVAFVNISEPEPGIYTVSPLGGPITMRLSRYLLSHGKARHAAPAYCSLSWSSDGQSLLFTGVESAPYSTQAIYALNLRTQQVTKLTYPPSGIWGDFSAHFSPDNKSIAFARWTSADVGEVFVFPISGGEPKQITHDNTIIRGLAWTNDGKELLIASGRGVDSGGRLALWRVRLNDGVANRLPLPTFNAWAPSISRRGSRLAFTTGVWETDIWEIQLKRELAERKVYSSTLYDFAGGYSPSGGKVVFNSTRSGHEGLWTVNENGSNALELTSETGLGSAQWSPDGKLIAFDAEPRAMASLFVVPANGGTRTRLTDGKAKDVVPRWSRDSRWIYFSSNRTGRWEIFKIPAMGGEAAQVTGEGGLFAQESLDARRLYFLKPEKGANLDATGPGIFVKSFANGSETVVKGTEHLTTRQFAVGKTGIYFVQYLNLRPVLSFLDFRTGQVQTVRTLNHQVFGSPTLALSPDEETVLYTSIDAMADLMLVEQFR